MAELTKEQIERLRDLSDGDTVTLCNMALRGLDDRRDAVRWRKQTERIAQLESQLNAANARLAGVVEECANVVRRKYDEFSKRSYPPPSLLLKLEKEIRALAPQSEQQADGVVPEGAFERWYNRTFRTRGVDTKHINDCEEAWNAALLAAAKEPR